MGSFKVFLSRNFSFTQQELHEQYLIFPNSRQKPTFAIY